MSGRLMASCGLFMTVGVDGDDDDDGDDGDDGDDACGGGSHDPFIFNRERLCTISSTIETEM